MASQTYNDFSGAATNGTVFNKDAERMLSESLESYLRGEADSSTLGGDSLSEDSDYHAMVQMRSRSRNMGADSTTLAAQASEMAANYALVNIVAPYGNAVPDSTIDPALLALDQVDLQFPEDYDKLVFEPDSSASGSSLEFDFGPEMPQTGADQSLDLQGQQWPLESGALDDSFGPALDPNQEFDLSGPTLDLDASSVGNSANVDYMPARPQACYNPALPLGAMYQDSGMGASGKSTQFDQAQEMLLPAYRQDFNGAQRLPVQGGHDSSFESYQAQGMAPQAYQPTAFGGAQLPAGMAVASSGINGHLDPRLAAQTNGQTAPPGAQLPAVMGPPSNTATVHQHPRRARGQGHAALNGAQQPVDHRAADTTKNTTQELGAPDQLPTGLSPPMTNAFQVMLTGRRNRRSPQSTRSKRSREQAEDNFEEGSSSATTSATENDERSVKRNRHGTPLTNPNKAANRQGQCPGWAQAKKQHRRLCKADKCDENCTLREMFPLSWAKFKAQRFRVKRKDNDEMITVSGLEMWRLGSAVSVHGELGPDGKLDPSSKDCHRVEYVPAVDGPRQ